MSVSLIEPSSYSKRRKYSEVLRDPRIKPQLSLEDIKQRLKEIRNYSLSHLDSLIARLTKNLAKKTGIDFIYAQDVQETVDYIKKTITPDRLIVINRSAVVSNELMAPLAAEGYRIIESYSDEFKSVDSQSPEYLPMREMPFEARLQSFEVPADLIKLRSVSIEKHGTKDFVGLLGINAISAEDGTILFLQHMKNISKVFEQASELVLVVSLDKIVRRLEDAVFQTKCMAIFGSEALPFNLSDTMKHEGSIDELPFSLLPQQVASKIHIIILDNDRTVLVKTSYKDFFLCIGCRACIAACPANQSGKPLSPRDLISNFKKYLSQVGPRLLEGEAEEFPVNTEPSKSGETIFEEAVWACTTCRNCHEVCPLQLQHLDGIMGLRRNLAMVSASETVRQPLTSIETRGHPWTGTTFTREDWTEGLGIKVLANGSKVDFLFWVGCTQALEARSIKVAQATARIMNKTGVSFGILGNEEGCCGEPARCLGNEYLFQLQAQKNIKTLHKYKVKKIITACPHCYNTLKNDYPQFGGKFEVIHHTEFINNLIKEGKLKTSTSNSETITYQDPCCLGRYNNIYQPPRDILKAIFSENIIEMKQNRERSFCCGGGGGRLWLKEGSGKKISEMRIDQVIETGAKTLATACPECLQMFEDAVKNKGVEGSIRIKDIAELVDTYKILSSG